MDSSKQAIQINEKLFLKFRNFGPKKKKKKKK